MEIPYNQFREEVRRFAMDTMNNIERKWLVANIVGFELGGFIGLFGVSGIVIVLSLIMEEITIPEGVLGVIGGFIGGVVVGLSQYLALRKRITISYPWLWIIACAVGLSVGVLVASYKGLNAELNPFDLRPLFLPWIMGGVLMGVIIGGLQWVTLRRNVPRAEIWIPGNIIADLVVVILFSYPFYTYLGINEAPNDSGMGLLSVIVIGGLCTFSGALAGLFNGLITLVPLRKLLKEVMKDNTPVAELPSTDAG
jgi:hypothetical protein